MSYTTSLLSGFFIVVEVDEHRLHQDDDADDGHDTCTAHTDNEPLGHVEHLLTVAIQKERGNNVDQGAQNGQDPRCLGLFAELLVKLFTR